jgi:hypothetical protein
LSGKKDVDPVVVAAAQRHIDLLTKVKGGRALRKPERRELEELEQMSKQAKAKKKSRVAAAAEIAADEAIESQKKAARYAGVDARTVRRWQTNGMLTAKRGGRTVYIKSQLDLFRRSQGRQLSEDRKREQKADADYKERKVEELELQIKQLRADYIDRAEVEKGNIARVQVLKRALLALERKVAGRMPAKYRRRVQQAIHTEVVEMINGFAGK